MKEKSQAKTEKIKEEKDEDDSDADSLDDDEFDDILSKVSKGGKDNLDYMSEIGSLPAEKQAKGIFQTFLIIFFNLNFKNSR